MNALLTSHHEFQIVTPRSVSGFHGRVLIVPAPHRISAEEMTSLRSQAGQRFQLYLADNNSSLPTIAPQTVTVTASPDTIAHIAKVDGKLHVFLDNFGGIRAKRNPRPSMESGVFVRFPEAAGSHVRILPFLGTVTEIAAERSGGKLVAKIPPFERAIVVWCE
jgi:hypothetical protein